MLRFLLALVLMNGLILGVSLSTWRPYATSLHSSMFKNLIVLVFILPVAVTFATTSLYHFLRPRRFLLDRFTGLGRALWIAASITILSVLFESLGMVFALDLYEQNLVIFSSCAASVLVLTFCRRPRPGFCQKCHYDLAGSLSFGRCPECGTPSMA